MGLTISCVALLGILAGRFSQATRGRTRAVRFASPANPIDEDDARPATSELPSPVALLEATMNSMREGVLVVDRAMHIVASNSAARMIFNRPENSLDGARLSDLTRNPAISNAFRAVLDEGRLTEVKVDLLDAGRHVFDLRVAPLKMALNESSRRAIGVFFDITQLERLERVRQEFLSNVSHELRTPLAAILAFVETLEDTAMDDAENNQRFLAIIRKNATRMHTLIDDILELSAIEAGNIVIEPTQVPLHPLVKDVFVALAKKAAARQITLRNEVGSDVVVIGDVRRLEQMLTNLIDNAIKFNRHGGAVTIKHERGAHDLIYVTDTGEGIAPRHLARLFERFYRVDRARSREMGGTGLGLAIVKHLARLHGGEISVQSELGEGSTFIVKLVRPPTNDTSDNSNHANLHSHK